MGKRVKINGYRGRFSDFQGIRMTILCVFFALGAVLGHVVAHVSGCDRELTSQLQSYVLLEGFGITPASLLSVSKLYLSYPLAVVIFGYCSFGAAVIPFVLAAQGFTFSFSSAALAIAFGRKGVVLALAAFGLRSILLAVCTLLLGMFVLNTKAETSEAKFKFRGNVVALCLLLLAVGIVLELTVVPKLFSMALATLK